MKIELKNLVVTRETAANLVLLGIIPISSLRWFKDYVLDVEPEQGEEHPFFWAVGEVEPELDTMPAYTYEEVRVLLGWNHNGAEYPEPRPKPMPREEFQYKSYFKTTVKTFEIGAEANAAYLIELLNSGELNVEDCNKRFKEKFNLK